MPNNRRIKTHSKKAGLAPGTLVHIGQRKTTEVRIRLIDYDEKNLQEKTLENVKESFSFKDSPSVSWVNIDGLHNTHIIENLGTHFNLHPLILEDIVNTGQRPKCEDHDNCIYIVLKMLSYSDRNNTVQSEQVSLVLGKNFLLTFQEVKGDVFEPIRERIRNGQVRIRKRSADYLAYTLIDAVVDNYFLVLEKMGEQIESMEEELLAKPSDDTVKKIHSLKRELISLRKSVWPLRDMLKALETIESPLISDFTQLYLRDVHDHAMRVIDTIESYREMASGMLDIYLTGVSNRMNEVMKVLTIFAAIFIPLTFIAGIYGMNFEVMPELKWKYGYFVVLLMMALVIVGMLVYFKRKKWL